MSVQKRPDHDPTPSHPRRDRDDFFGLDVERMSPRAQITASLAVLMPVAVGVVAVLTLTSLWWLIFTFGWMIFPAFGLLVRGVAGLSEGQGKLPSAPACSKERELLGALREEGELTPAQAAMETSLTVEEADGMLRKLAEGGHLQVRVHGGGLFYSLWEVEGGKEAGQLEGR
jgi:hypothetical protein